MAYTPATAIQTQASKVELSNTYVHGPAQRGLTNLNAQLVAQTLIAAARQKAGFVTPRPSAPIQMYTNPDGTLCTSHADSIAFHQERFYTPV